MKTMGLVALLGLTALAGCVYSGLDVPLDGLALRRLDDMSHLDIANNTYS